MEKTDAGTTVGVDDPYAFLDRCDYCTEEGRCRFAAEHGDRDPPFADGLSGQDFRCPVVGDPLDDGLTGPWTWKDCPHMRSRDHARECARCGLEARRSAHDDERPLLEEHHLSYANRDSNAGGSTAASDTQAPSEGDTQRPSHEITIYLCRWCHAKIHNSWASVDDPANPDPNAIAARERRRSREQAQLTFETAADRRERE
ncbi:hypothetical protein Hrd1104_01880 [Halorhabdus sp. CBA1104]|uniref:DUF7097 family protein n=1 Tax=unclassified Halorhabdus TaxID=2621901 RepID=UPI0012B3259B|nr:MULTISPECIES: hypothetical protein [unclassified Halorhabdus]QGN06163.1 hypothetical protein Hrd1104_01880 [Halorhabdus sp. CBA1104]